MMTLRLDITMQRPTSVEATKRLNGLARMMFRLDMRSDADVGAVRYSEVGMLFTLVT